MNTTSAPTTPPLSKKRAFRRLKTFQCTGFGNCNMIFSRSEHLARHIRKHTGEKPFKCEYPDCFKSFSRFDNMRQHIQTHERQKKRKNGSTSDGDDDDEDGHSRSPRLAPPRLPAPPPGQPYHHPHALVGHLPAPLHLHHPVPPQQHPSQHPRPQYHYQEHIKQEPRTPPLPMSSDDDDDDIKHSPPPPPTPSSMTNDHHNGLVSPISFHGSYFDDKKHAFHQHHQVHPPHPHAYPVPPPPRMPMPIVYNAPPAPYSDDMKKLTQDELDVLDALNQFSQRRPSPSTKASKSSYV
ncbi:hypothetical protein BC940DRAFT_132774 [Gongronella butleri]|nr:hypothetical protein BC940DRAFT_132774 [Gongronella butleri]